MELSEIPSLTIKRSLYLLLLLITCTAVITVPVMLYTGYHTLSYFQGQATQSFIDLLTYALPYIPVILLGLKWIQKNSVQHVKERLELPNYKVLVIGILLTPFLGVLIDFLSNTLLPDPPEYLNKVFNRLIKPNTFAFLLLAVAPAILEEMLFRGVILEGMLKRYAPWKAILWSAVLFGAFHLNLWQALLGVMLGLYIGWLYYKTQSLLPGIFIHFANNTLSFVLLLTFKSETKSLEELMGHFNYYALLGGCIAIFLAGVWYLHSTLTKKSALVPIAT